MSSLYLSLDLEMEQPSQEIIQIGAVIGDIAHKLVSDYSDIVGITYLG